MLRALWEWVSSYLPYTTHVRRRAFVPLGPNAALPRGAVKIISYNVLGEFLLSSNLDASPTWACVALRRTLAWRHK
jgi:hypothetical protein